jgi:hypothetical protein
VPSASAARRRPMVSPLLVNTGAHYAVGRAKVQAAADSGTPYRWALAPDRSEVIQVSRAAGAERMDLRYSEEGGAFHFDFQVFL